MRPIKLLCAAACGLLVSCAVITVNVYFPEKAVKDAYKSVDDMMLKGGGESLPTLKNAPPDNMDITPKTEPLSKVIRSLPTISYTATAHAAEYSADELAVELASMPDVTSAYEVMSRNLGRVRELQASGVVGLTSQGLISIRSRDKMTPQDEAVLKSENESRKTIITGMAKAILKLNKQSASKADMDQLLGKSAATYAETKRDEAAPGWWLQLPNGRWVQK